MNHTQTYIGTLVVHTCVNSKCGVIFGLEAAYDQERRNDHEAFTCPNGHSQWYSAKNKEELLQQEIKQKQETIDYLQRAKNQLHNQVTTLNYSVRSLKAAKTKIINRVKRGVCPCCNRRFENLQWHFESKHPELLEKA